MLSLAGWVSRGLVLLAMVLATASITTSGEWGEEGVAYAELGSDVALTCPGGNPSSTTRWQRHGGSGLPSNSRVQQGQLFLSHVDLPSEGTYSCQDGAGLPLGSVALRVGPKPDPPERVRVEPVPQAPRRLRVSWEYPSSWRKELSFQLHFRLRYRPVLHDSWSIIETSNVSEVITDAVMGLEHTVQVSAKDYLDAGSWSEWSPEVRAWPAAGQVTEPSQAAPDTVELDPPAEEPSPVPDNEPVAGQGDSMEKVAMLVSLGVFAFFALVALLLFAFLV
ncbi:putative Interleukin-11 receptor subunit alpha protein [Naja naja]|nr:putative Interleukin-11 receptor subunit alpha protein [Naja naja]